MAPLLGCLLEAARSMDRDGVGVGHTLWSLDPGRAKQAACASSSW